MRPQLAACLAIVVVVAIAGCQSASGSPSAANLPSATSPPTGGSASPPDAGPAIDPAWITRPALTCGDPDRLFPPEALAGLGLAELGIDPASAVLSSTIADTPDYYPDTGWHRVLENPEGVTFVAAGNAEMPWFEVTIGMFDGSLQPIRQGQCTLAIAAPNGVSFARWWLDPAGRPVTPETTTLDVLIRERECASGKPPEGRVLAPTIISTAESIQVAMGLREQLTAQDCQGNPAYGMDLVISEPIGSRALFDASQFPPRLVTAEDPG